MKKVFIGVDVSSTSLDVSITTDCEKYEILSILNNEKSILGFFDYLLQTYKNSTFFFGYEATGNYSYTLQKLLSEKEYKQIMINPFLMSHYLKHLNQRKKSDIIDSVGINRYIQTLNETQFKTIFSDEEKTFKKYTASIDFLRKMETQLKNFIHSQKNHNISNLDNLILNLQTSIKELKKLLEKEAKELLLTLYPFVKTIKEDIKGVGYALLLELIPIFIKSKNYTIKELQSFVGLTPRIFQSGTSVNKKERISKRGNSLVRKMLFMSTLTAIRFNEIIKEKYNRLLSNGKNKMVAVVACMCHLFRAIFTKYNHFIKGV